MDKHITPIPPTSEIRTIPGTQYVVIDNRLVAKLLTPMTQGLDEQTFFNLFIEKKCRRLSLDRVVKLSKGEPDFKE